MPHVTREIYLFIYFICDPRHFTEQTVNTARRRQFINTNVRLDTVLKWV